MCMAEKGNLRLQKAVWQCTQPVDIDPSGQLQHTLEVWPHTRKNVKKAMNVTQTSSTLTLLHCFAGLSLKCQWS